MLINPFPTRITDSANRPISGGKAFFYRSGTVTLQTIYSDPDLETARANPVVASAAGLLPSIFLDTDLTYDVIYTDATGDTGSPLYSAEAVSGSGGASRPIDEQTGANYAIVSGDRGRIVQRTHTAAMTAVLPAANAANIGNGFYVTISNVTSAYDITVSVSGGGTIDGAASYILKPGQRGDFVSDGTEYFSGAGALTTGKRSFPIPAAAWAPTTTNGCAAIAHYESTTNKVNYDGLAFDGFTKEYAYFVMTTPKSYLAGSMQFRVAWTAAAGTAGNVVKWSLGALARADDAVVDAAYGTPGLVDDALLATGDVHVSAWTAFTPASDAAECALFLRIERDAANDTHNSDAVMVAVELRLSMNAPNDA